MQIYNFESQMVFVGRRNKMTTLSVAGADLRQEIYIYKKRGLHFGVCASHPV